MLFVFHLLFACQEKEPLTCEYGEEIYAVGDSFSAMDGCNSCSCDAEDGEAMVTCTLMACDTGDIPEPDTDCVSLSIDECEAADQCTVIMASQVIVDDEEECFLWANSIDNVGCMDADMGCGEAITYAESPETPGECYGFTNTCIPDGWSECSLGSFPECD
jgi:hypothetical protein